MERFLLLSLNSVLGCSKIRDLSTFPRVRMELVVRGSKRSRLFAKKLRKNQTSSEKLLWECLRRNKLGVPFRRQAPIRGYIADFYCPRARLVIELDGQVHQFRTEYDRKRDAALGRHGLKVVRFSSALIFHRRLWVLNEIRRQLSERLAEF